MPKENKLTLKRQRAEQVKQAIRIIADHGRGHEAVREQAGALPVFRQPVAVAA